MVGTPTVVAICLPRSMSATPAVVGTPTEPAFGDWTNGDWVIMRWEAQKGVIRDSKASSTPCSGRTKRRRLSKYRDAHTHTSTQRSAGTSGACKSSTRIGWMSCHSCRITSAHGCTCWKSITLQTGLSWAILGTKSRAKVKGKGQGKGKEQDKGNDKRKGPEVVASAVAEIVTRPHA